MSEKMVERVAKTIRRYRLDDASYTLRMIDTWTGDEYDISDEGEVDKANARAALSAMREPPTSVIGAGLVKLSTLSEPYTIGDVEDVLDAIIDAALYKQDQN